MMSGTITTTARLGASRQRIIETLAQHPIKDKSGRCTSILMEQSGYTGSLTGLSALLKAMDDAGTIQREVKGKRCFAITLVDEELLAAEKARAAQKVSFEEKVHVPSSNGLIVEAPPADASVEEIDEVEADVDLDPAAIAKSLLEQVISLAGKPSRDAEENKRLRSELSQVQQRLYEATERAEKMRQRMSITEDELAAKKVEADGLRMRLRETERNLDAIVNAKSGVRLDFERERELKDLIRMMKAPQSKG
jgi:myosin heavy subunit